MKRAVGVGWIGITACLYVLLGASTLSAPTRAAVIANDGGITLWVSYDNLDVTGASLDDTITEVDDMPGGFSCNATNTGRSDLGEPDSPPSCPGGTGSCTAAEKITGDIEFLADYIHQSTEGAHYLRRVYVSDEGRAWSSADIKWNIGVGGSSAPTNGWANSDSQMSLNSGYRTCIHDVLHHELGHYMYRLPDRYANSSGYYQGSIGGGTTFQVDVTARDINTVMSNNFPHLFVDATNAEITVDYDQPGPGSTTGQVLTPDLLTDGDASNDGPDRAHHGFTMPFAQDEWSVLPDQHVDLAVAHTEGTFGDAGPRPDVEIVFIGDDEPHPGTVLLLDRSGSMGVTTNGITAAQFVQEAGMFLYHSSQPGDSVGTYLYNANVEELFPYDEYDATNDLPFVSFRNATGLTDIAKALETAIDELIAEHGEGGVSGAEIYLMSDGRQTTGDSLWDQVTRASERGIRIHTFSFGDADSGTMESIASGASGSTIPMSERDDAAELKMLMGRRFSTGRGRTPVFVYKGRMRGQITLGSTQLYFGQFEVPPKSRALQFYAFLHQGNASQAFDIALKAPGGATFNAAPPDNTEQKGRFKGIKIDKPEPGTWVFFIAGKPGFGLPDEDVELVAYADNPELDGRVWIGDSDEEYIIPLYATMRFRYPLSNVNVNASLYAQGRLLTVVRMYDDGKANVDVQKSDGIYSAVIDFSPAEWDKLMRSAGAKTEKIRVEVEFDITEESGPAPLAHYETGFTKSHLDKDYGKANRSSFKAWATGVINLGDFKPAPPDDPRLICNWCGPEKVRPGDTGKLRCKIENDRPLLDQLRVSLGPGVVVNVRRQEERAEKGEKKDAMTHRVQDTPPILSRPFMVDYEVKKGAEPGPRVLRVQFANTILKHDEALHVYPGR